MCGRGKLDVPHYLSNKDTIVATQIVERIAGPDVWHMIDDYARIFGLKDLEAKDVVRFGYVPDNGYGSLELVVFNRDSAGQRVGKTTYKKEIDTTTVTYADWVAGLS